MIYAERCDENKRQKIAPKAANRDIAKKLQIGGKKKLNKTPILRAIRRLLREFYAPMGLL
jgi:hypothetical protein